MKFSLPIIKINTLCFLLLIAIAGNSQSLPIDFESAVTTSDFVDFDGGTAAVLANPQPGSINSSATVAQIIRDGGEIWAGSKIILDNNLEFTTLNSITMKVFTTAPVGTVVKFKLESSSGATERDVLTTVSNEWEELTWDFTGVPTTFNEVVFMFDFGNVGDGSTSSTFYFDDVEQLFGGTHIDLPVDFQSTTVNYTMSDFGGNQSSLVVGPVNSNNMAIKVIKTDQAATWAGTTIGTPAGFATDIPISLAESKMSVRVWSPAAGTPIRLKIEDSDDPTHTCETETNTTVSGDWEYMEFDFTNEAPGTESLSVGLSMGWTYNMASIFFNFGTDGATAGETTYYFDDVIFGEWVVNTTQPEITGLSVFPNPTDDYWTFSTDNSIMTSVEIYDLQGRNLLNLTPVEKLVKIDASSFLSGAYYAKISTATATSVVKLLKK